MHDSKEVNSFRVMRNNVKCIAELELQKMHNILSIINTIVYSYRKILSIVLQHKFVV